MEDDAPVIYGLEFQVLSDVAVAHDDEYRATAAAAEHFDTKVVLLKGTLVEFINILNYKNVISEIPGLLARALTPQTAETDAIRFLVGTQSLRYDNQVLWSYL